MSKFDLLDVCCGKKVWLRGRPALTMDKVIELRPDVVGDMTRLPFKDGSFVELWCDPPHLIRKCGWGPKSGKVYGRYGCWPTRTDWFSALKRMNDEFARVLSPHGMLLFKIADGKAKDTTQYDHLLDYLTNFEVVTIEGHKSRLPWSSATTLYVTYRNSKL